MGNSFLSTPCRVETLCARPTKCYERPHSLCEFLTPLLGFSPRSFHLLGYHTRLLAVLLSLSPRVLRLPPISRAALIARVHPKPPIARAPLRAAHNPF
jgi:hypothetical protein